jgi:hypothetical protein
MGLTVIAIEGIKANEVLSIVSELRASGMVQGKDFSFAFHQTRWDEATGDIPDRAEFTFYEEKYATLFSLKYA